MPYVVQSLHVESILTAVIRENLSSVRLAAFVPAACGEVWNSLRRFPNTKPGRHIALYRKPDQIVEVGAEITERFDGDDRVVCSQLPSGFVATVAHFGPYERMSLAYQAIENWCISHHRLMTGVAWEIYGHWQDDWNRDSSKIRTDVYALINEG